MPEDQLRRVTSADRAKEWPIPVGSATSCVQMGADVLRGLRADCHAEGRSGARRQHDQGEKVGAGAVRWL
jgi:hypothetical protein